MVTGAAGFIGSHFVDYVLENHPEDQVIGFDCLSYAGNMKNLELAIPNKRFEFVKGDIRNTDEVDPVVAKVDAIVNFAAETHVDRSIASSIDFISTNVLGVNVLLESALKNQTSVFHQISTDEVYGSVESGFSKEEDKLMPRSPYAASKASADLLVESFRVTHGLNTKITRASNNYGIRQYPEKLIPLFITKLLRGEKVPLYGTGANIRDWLFVLDHARAVDLVFRGSASRNIFNISGENLKTNKEITQIILQKIGLTDDRVEFVRDRKGHDFRYAVDNSNLKAEYDFNVNTDFEIELTRVIQSIEKSINS